jgi:PHS family inorganic phosphate transporter-like MFS transporter
VTSLILSNGLPTTALEDAWNSAFICVVAVPGYWLSVQYLERVGRKNVQMMGFTAMGILFLICGLFRDWFLAEGAPFSRKVLFLVLYSLTFLFSNFGPNTTTFVIPGEIYPAEVRATCHGVSAACGKLGAATGAFFFPLVLGPAGATKPTNAGLRMSMFLCAGIYVYRYVL